MNCSDCGHKPRAGAIEVEPGVFVCEPCSNKRDRRNRPRCIQCGRQQQDGKLSEQKYCRTCERRFGQPPRAPCRDCGRKPYKGLKGQGRCARCFERANRQPKELRLPVLVYIPAKLKARVAEHCALASTSLTDFVTAAIEIAIEGQPV